MKLTIFLLFICSATFAQSDSSSFDTLKYGLARIDGSSLTLRITADDPEHLPDLSITTGAALGARPGSTFDLMWAFQARYIFENYGSIDARLNLPTFDGMDNQFALLQNSLRLQTTNNYRLFTNVDVALGFNLKDTSYYAYQKIRVHDNQTAHAHKVDRRTMVQFTTKHLIGGRVGYYFHQGIANNSYLESDLVDNTGLLLAAAGSTELYHTNYMSHAIFLGADVKTFRKLTLEVDDHPIQHSVFYNFFVDIFFAPSIALDPMNVRNFDTGIVTSHDVSNAFTTMPIGGRFGVEVSKFFDKHDGITLQAEVGARPGISNAAAPNNLLGDQLYVLAKLMYTFGIETKKE